MFVKLNISRIVLRCVATIALICLESVLSITINVSFFNHFNLDLLQLKDLNNLFPEDVQSTSIVLF